MSLDMNLPATFKDLESLTAWAWDNFKRLEEEFNFGREAFYLKELHEEPRKPRVGQIVLADGTDWNPGGTGAGVYAYYGGAWHKLG